MWKLPGGRNWLWGNLGLVLMGWAAAAAKSLQSCPTLCDPIDGSPTGSAVPGILQARTLEWGAIAFSGRKLSTEELMLLNSGVGEDS